MVGVEINAENKLNYMKYFITIIFLLMGISVTAQVKLEGVIKDSLGNPLELANVIAINKATKSLDSYAITNDDELTSQGFKARG